MIRPVGVSLIAIERDVVADISNSIIGRFGLPGPTAGIVMGATGSAE